MKQYFAYTRVSTQKQGEGVSLEAQRDVIDAYAKRSDLVISRWFEEKVTAAKIGRPVFNTMVKELRSGKAEGIIVHKIDRSTRNFADWARLGDLVDAGFDLRIATESLDLGTRGGRLSADIQVVFAAEYIRNLRDETMKGMRGRLKQGYCPWGAPFGYRNNGGGKLKTVDPRTGPIVARVFELYASGQYSLASLAAELKRLELRGSSGLPLSKHSLELMLANPFYCGVLKLASTGETFDGRHEPLIPVSLFRRVQDIKAGRTGPKLTRHDFLFRGALRCDLCDRSITGELQKGHTYYRCHTPDCPTKSTREEAIDQAVAGMLRNLLLPDADQRRLMAQVETFFRSQPVIAVRDTTKARLTQARERLSSLTDALIDKHIDASIFTPKKEALLLDIKQLEQEMAAPARATTSNDLSNFFELTKSLARTYEIAEPAEKRQILGLVSSNLRLAPKELVVEPANWLVPLESSVADPSGDPPCHVVRMSLRHVEAPNATRPARQRSIRAWGSPTSRRRMSPQHIEQLLELIWSAPVRELQALGKSVSQQQDAGILHSDTLAA